MLEGTTVQTDEEAAELNDIPRVRLAIADGRQKPFAPGAFAMLPHCLKDDAALEKFARDNGRPCPRVVLDPDNYEALTLLTMSIRPEVRPFAQPYFEATHAGADAETRRNLLMRVTCTLTDKRVTEALYQKEKA